MGVRREGTKTVWEQNVTRKDDEDLLKLTATYGYSGLRRKTTDFLTL